MDALPVPRGWVPDAWFKAYNAADSQIYHLVGKDCRISRRKRESGETRERALGLWERYPINKVMWAETREDREVAVAVMEEEESDEEEGEEGEEDGEVESGDEESGEEEEVGERGTEIVWEQEVEESEEGEDEETVDKMDVDGESVEEAYDVSYLFEDF
ncbi:hypothetical protein V492_03813 [Pseudogymnoascus sp. VKM F-4246]|nr:hypothetical protein V492_03813 [Pseudogymnoascus sp. VKM F-4246]